MLFMILKKMTSLEKLAMNKKILFISHHNDAELGIMKNYSDLDFSFRYIGIIDLEGKGNIQEIGVEYKLVDNIKLLFAINKIQGNKEIKVNQFVEMENFSHFRLQMKYFY